MRLDLQGHPLHTRALSVTVTQRADGRWDVHASLLDLRKRGFIPVDGDYRAAEGIYAIGDVIGPPSLAAAAAAAKAQKKATTPAPAPAKPDEAKVPTSTAPAAPPSGEGAPKVETPFRVRLPVTNRAPLPETHPCTVKSPFTKR